jgi:hypothetical protein
MSTIADSDKAACIKGEDAELQRIGAAFHLSVFVLFTSTNQTLKALEKARELARPFGAGILVVAAQVVPYPLPLDRPLVPFEFVVRRFKEMAERFPENTRVFVYLCRDLLEALKQILTPNSLVVIGIRKRVWPTREERLARKLRRAGHDVVLVEAE